MDPAIFLDRDGTLVPGNAAEVDPSKLAPISGVTDALKRLRETGFRLVVATNQGAVARGRSSEAEVDALNQRVGALIDGRTGIARTIERFYYCPFDPKGTVPEYSREHPWRKPNPGMLRQAARDMSLDLARSWLIGGSPNDIAAGRAAGVRTVLVSRELAHIAEAAADFTAANMADAVAIVLKHQADRPKQRPEAAAAQPAPARAAAGSTATATRPRTRKSATERLRRARNGERLRRALGELAEEVRALRLRRAETGSLRIAAMALQLATLLVAAVAIISLAEPEAFLRWSVGAVFLQLATATVLLFDRS
ncbi:MAG: D-glycero-alpha-D-manno-heptose-1,7-bisphosphate 7-phosphatase [Planctomycetota bacterium]